MQIDDKNYYLIIKSLNGDVGFPKGHMEKDESEIETAIRELKEETNIDVEVLDGFRIQIEYKMPNMIDVMKQSVYFLGRCITDDIICQENEVFFAKFMSYYEAIEVLTFEETKLILQEAEKYIC